MEGTIRVLHVDDDPDFADLTGTLLEREDSRFAVETETAASDGLHRLAETEFDCVISDYEMPGTNGIEFLEAVRETHPEIPFILFTGQGSEGVASEAISAGVTDYFPKRSGTEQYEILAHRIRNAVEQRRTAQRAATLDRVRTLLTDVSAALVGASGRDEIETRVCEIISDADPFRFAWIGEVDETTDRIEPRASVGIQEGYLEEITVTADERSTGRGPAGRALGREDVAVSQNVQSDPDFEPWREAALERGFRAVAAVPLSHEGTVYGPLAVYADRPHAFDETERELLAELGDNVSRALYAAETRSELERTNTLVSTLLDVLPVGILAEDADRNVLAANRRLLELFDVPGSPADAVGTDCRQFATEVSDLLEEPKPFLDRLDELVAERDPIGNETLALSDGRTLERTYEPIELPDGDGHLWVYRDATDRTARKRERERRTEELETLTTQLEAQYRYLFEETPVMVVVTRNRDGVPVIDDCNTLFAETIGYDRQAIVGRELATFYTSESTSELLDGGGYERGLDGEFDREERTLVRNDGETIDTVVRSVPRPNAFGNIEGTISLYIDVTERERIKRERDRLEEFTEIVSHDLRNPLNVAEGRLELAELECDSEHLESIDRAHDRMHTLIESLLALARSGERVDETEPIDIAVTAKRCWENVETGDSTLTVATDRTVEADPSRFGQLFENLFRNCVEHGLTSGRAGSDDSVEHGRSSVTVTVGDCSDTPGIYVEDDGVGIPEPDRDSVFESGYSTSENGTGLGLRIVERIVDGHGWEIRVTESDDGGARFEIFGFDSG